MIETIECPISGQKMYPVFSQKILGKYPITYYYCKESGLLKTENPYWLEEAYQEPINIEDTGLVSRNIQNSNMVETILYVLQLTNDKILDVAGGYGLLTRLMRDKGFDCYTIDQYCQNLFAKHFEPDANFQAVALFAFEVLEHVENPLQFISNLFQQYNCRTLIFSTLTFNGEVPSQDWWYYVFEGGQHITFYQPRTFSLLASSLGCEYYMFNQGFHMITDIKIPKSKQYILFNPCIFNWYSIYVRSKRKWLSKTWEDHLKMKEYKIQEQKKQAK